jgi:hypothetical protein
LGIVSPQCQRMGWKRGKGERSKWQTGLIGVLASALPTTIAFAGVRVVALAEGLQNAWALGEEQRRIDRSQWLVILFTAATLVEGETRPNESFVATTSSIPARRTRSIRSGVRTAA